MRTCNSLLSIRLSNLLTNVKTFEERFTVQLIEKCHRFPVPDDIKQILLFSSSVM